MAKQLSSKKRHWQLDWKTGVLTLIFVPVAVSLGFWQFDRAEEKRQLLLQQEQQALVAPVPVQSLNNEELVANRRVTLAGYFDNSKNWLLDNRMRNGKPGYEVVSLFVITENQQKVLINRGWVPGDISRKTLPSIKDIEGQQQLQASVYISPGKPLTLAEEIQQIEWPKVIQQIDWNYIGQDIEGELLPLLLRIDPYSHGAYLTDWTVVNVQPEKHTAYAVQWFAMAAILLLLFIIRSRNMMKPSNQQ